MYKYETHLHTNETSRCGKSSGAEHARYLASLGYTGFFVTDHFFNGNTRVPRSLPWSDTVHCFALGYYHAKEEAEKLGLDVFFGWEYSFGWAHLLTYNLGVDWLLKNTDVCEWSGPEYMKRVHADGGYIVHAHPFRLTGNPVMPVFPELIDAVEVINAGRSDPENQRAQDFAHSYGLPETAGSDIHNIHTARHAGILSETRFANSADYMKAVLSRKVQIFEDYPADEYR